MSETTPELFDSVADNAERRAEDLDEHGFPRAAEAARQSAAMARAAAARWRAS